MSRKKLPKQIKKRFLLGRLAAPQRSTGGWPYGLLRVTPIKRRKRILLVLALILLTILTPLVYLKLREAGKAQAAWWQGDGTNKYIHRQRLTVTNNSGDNLANGTTIAVSIDTKTLHEAGKVQADCDDLMVLYQPNDSTATELTRYTTYPNGTTCATSEATTVNFKLQSALSDSASSSSYYVYYGSPHASAQANQVDAFDIDDANALLVCPFDGDTDCINGSGAETPSTETGAIRYSGGKSALSFDGESDYVSVTDDNSLHLDNNFTLELWFKANTWQAGENGLLGKLTNWSTMDWQLYYRQTTTEIIFRIGESGGDTIFESLNSNPSAGEWHHLAITKNGTTYELFLDGTSQGTETSSTTWTDSDNLAVGANSSTGNYFNGLLDEVRISNTIRYTSNFTAPTAPFVRDDYTALLLHFDENGEVPYGTSLGGSDNLAVDDSGNGNHGTITGAKYVAGLIGVDGDSTAPTSLNTQTQSYAAHTGIFIEEATTNLVTNPSFEHDTYNTNWSTADGTLNYDSSSDTFTESMAKRNAPGPFAAAPIVQGGWATSGETADSLSATIGNNIGDNFYENFDLHQGSVVLWVTPEWDGSDNKKHILFNSRSQNVNCLYKAADNNLYWDFGWSANVSVDISSWTAGTTYLVVARWDLDNTLDDTNYLSLSIGDSHTFSYTSSISTDGRAPTGLSIGQKDSWDYRADAIIEGLTIYRRPLTESEFGTGINVGNDDEIGDIFNGSIANSQDPTLVTGSWDVVFALPTDSSTGSLSSPTATGEAWTHPHSSNKLPGNSDTGGFMLDGTYGNDGWQDILTPTVDALATGEKIFAGGYKTTSNVANEGIYDEIAVTSGDDFVIRAMAHGDVNSVPKISITGADDAVISNALMTGANETGSHTSGTHATIMTDSNATWTADEWIGYTIYNTTDGSSGEITDNDATTATVAELTGGGDNQWENADAYRVGSNRTRPDIFLYTFEADATENIKVKLTNTATSGTVYWHQVEVLSNLMSNPSMETGSGDPSGSPTPWTPTGWWSNLDAGEGVQETAPSLVHSGSSSMKINDIDLSVERITYTPSTTLNKFYSSGAWMYETVGNMQYGASSIYAAQHSLTSSSNMSNAEGTTWTFFPMVYRRLQSGGTYVSFQGQAQSATGYGDDFYMFQLTDVDLTVTPADETNSTETSGLRVDGNDTLTQTITNLTDKSGTIKFEITPRHDFADSDLFGFTQPVIAEIYGDSDDYIKLIRQDDSTLRVEAQFAGTSVNADWTDPPVLNAGTTYIIKITYEQGGNLVLYIDGVQEASTAIGSSTAFSTVPTTIYFGADQSGSNQYDLTIDDAAVTAPTVSENTTAPYYKFGSKSAQINVSAADSGNYISSISPGNTNTHTLSAYIYDATSGNVGGTVDSSIANLVWEDTTPSTTFTDMGGGWWRLTYSVAATDSANNYGVHVADGKTVYVDGVQLETQNEPGTEAYATSYTDGSLGTGYSWSGTAHESTSTRASADLTYSTTNNLSCEEGSISFWLKESVDFPDTGEYYPYILGTTGTGDNRIAFTRGYQGQHVRFGVSGNNPGWYSYNAQTSTSSWTVGSWHHVVGTWEDTGNLRLYLDGSETVGDATTDLADTCGATLRFDHYADTESESGHISNLRTYNARLSSTEVTDLYYSGLVSHSQQYEVDAFDDAKGQAPLAVWHFEEGYGTTAHDSSKYGNDLTFGASSAAPTWSSWSPDSGGTIGSRVLEFDGTDDYIYQSHDTDFDFGTGSFTVSGYFRHPSSISGTDTLLARYDDTGYKVYMNSSGYLCFGIDNDSTWTPTDEACSTVNYADSSWHHFSAVKDGTTSLTLYIDGNSVASDNTLTAQNSLNDNTSLYVGIDSDGSSNPWDGFLDDIVFYPYARSADQVKLDNLGNQISVLIGSDISDNLTDGLVGYWKMDESSWDGTANEIIDSSGNKNHGYALGETTPASTSVGKFGKAGDLDGDEDYLNMGSDSSLRFTTENFTLSGWGYIASSGDVANADILIKRGGYQHSGYYLSFTGSGASLGLRFRTNQTGQSQTITSTSGSVPIGSWFHWSVVRNGSVGSIYFNSEETSYAERDSIINPRSNSDDLIIGEWLTLNRHPKMKLDEIRVYQRALSSAEISDLYNWAPGPVGHWKMDEGTGTGAYAVKDTSGNANHGTMEASMTESDWVAGRYGSALDFDGTNDYINAGTGSTLDITTDHITVSAWIKSDSWDQSSYINGVVDKAGSDFNTGYQLRFGDGDAGDVGKPQFIVNGSDGRLIDDQVLNTGQWHHLSGTYDGTTIRLYVNGVEAASRNKTGNIPTNTNPLLIGRNYTTGRYFDGLIDDVRIYNYARTPAQIIEDMNAGHPAPGSPVGSPVGYWKFDEGYGDTANDSSIQNNDGDLGGSGQICPATGTVPCPSRSNDGKFGKALDFDGGDDYVSKSDDPSLDLSTFTISLWTKNTEINNSVVLEKGAGGYTPNYYLFSDDASCSGTWMAGANNSAGNRLCANNEINDDTWHHVLLTYTDTDANLYIDGVLNDNIDPANDVVTNNDPLTIGSRSGTVGFDGLIDEVKIYNFALTTDQVKLDYNQGAAAVWGATSTDSSNNPSWSSTNEYCPPGQGSTCTAPIAHWKLDEKTGLSAFDTSENNNTGTLTAGPTWRPQGVCKKGACLEFDGSDDYVQAADSASLDNITSAITISGWVLEQSHDQTLANIIMKGWDHISHFRLYISTSSRLAFIYHDGSSHHTYLTSSSVLPNFNEWYHVAISYTYGNASSAKFFVNGQEKTGSWTAGDGTGSASPNNNSVCVGRLNCTGGFRFDGLIDDVRIYNYARTPAQIAWDYNRGGPVGHWRLDECSGTTAYDSSGNSNNGTITNPGSGTNTSIGTCNSGAGNEMWDNGTTGKRNASLDFDGTDDYVEASLPSGITYDGPVSISVWVKRTTGTNLKGFLHLIEGATATNQIATFYFDPSNNGLRVGRGNNALYTVQAANPITQSQWNHVVIVNSGGNVRSTLYVNGVDNSADATNPLSAWGDNVVHLGRGLNASYHAPCQIDDVQIFNYALTEQQIRTLFNDGAVHFGP